MKPWFLAAALSVAMLGIPASGAAQTATASPAAADQGDPAIMARAKEWLHRLQTGDIDRSQLTAQVNSALTPAIASQIAAQYGPLGDPTSFTYVGKQSVQGNNTAYVYRVVFKTGSYSEVLVLDQTGKIAGIQVPPAN